MNQEIYAVGTVEGTGAAINVKLGFKPRYVRVYNHDDAGSLMPMVEWYEGMTAGHGIKWLIGTTYTTPSKITSGGISQYDTDFEGFTIGTDTDINASGETLFWHVIR